MIVHVDNSYVWIGTENEILFFKYKNGIRIDLPMAILAVSQRLLVQNGKYFPVLCDVSEIKAVSRSARIYLSKEGSILVTTLALVTNSKLSTYITKFYLITNDHLIGTRVFRNKGMAIQFLRSL